jgi:hypothetical protein
VRVSDADARVRHRGVSHHTATALELARSQPAVPVPASLAGVVPGAVTVGVPDVAAVLADLGLHVTSMGRGPAEDPVFFQAAGAAGAWAAAALGQP